MTRKTKQFCFYLYLFLTLGFGILGQFFELFNSFFSILLMPIALISAILLSVAFLVIIIGATSYVIEIFGIDTIFNLNNEQEKAPIMFEMIIKKIKPPKK